MKLPIQDIARIYLETKSIRKTAQLTGYSKSGIEYLLKKNNIKLFSNSRSGKENSQFKMIDNSPPLKNPTDLYKVSCT